MPGIGPKSAERIVIARRNGRLGLTELKNIGVVLKRAQYFIRTSDGPVTTRPDKETTVRALIDPQCLFLRDGAAVPLSGDARSPAAAHSP